MLDTEMKLATAARSEGKPFPWEGAGQGITPPSILEKWKQGDLGEVKQEDQEEEEQ